MCHRGRCRHQACQFSGFAQARYPDDMRVLPMGLDPKIDVTQGERRDRIASVYFAYIADTEGFDQARLESIDDGAHLFERLTGHHALIAGLSNRVRIDVRLRAKELLALPVNVVAPVGSEHRLARCRTAIL